MSQKLSQGFECEIDSSDWISCEKIDNELVISFQSEKEDEEDDLRGVTLGFGQVQNLIEFLVRVRTEMQRGAK